MKRHAEAGRLPRRAALALAVAAVLSFAGPAEASCGSHVRVGDDPAPCADGHCQPAPPPVAPCTGPACSRAPEGAPVVPPVAPTPRAGDAIPGALEPRSPTPSRFHRPADSALEALHRDRPPEPPPR
jgi:hypothetical protein